MNILTQIAKVLQIPDTANEAVLFLKAGEIPRMQIYQHVTETGDFRIDNFRLVPESQKNELLLALKVAEDFMAGFEDDDVQEGINDKLAQIRAAIKKAESE